MSGANAEPACELARSVATRRPKIGLPPRTALGADRDLIRGGIMASGVRAASPGSFFSKRMWVAACNQPAGFASMASTTADAHAFATADRYFSFTLATQPALMTKLSRFQVLSFFKSTSCSGCCSAFTTQSGVSARTVASWAPAATILSADPPVTQPPQPKPIIIAAAAPPIAPHIAGFTDAGTCIVNLPFSSFDSGSSDEP